MKLKERKERKTFIFYAIFDRWNSRKNKKFINNSVFVSFVVVAAINICRKQQKWMKYICNEKCIASTIYILQSTVDIIELII